MKKLLLAVGVCASTLCFGQANTAGTIHAGLGWGLTLGGAKIIASGSVLGIPFESTSTGIGGNSNYGVSGGYGIADMFSAGIYLRKEGAAYITTDEYGDASTATVSAMGFGVGGKLYAVNKDKFTLYVAPALGLSTGKVTGEDDYSYDVYTGKGTGLNYTVAGGLGWYWADFIGMYFDFGYNGSSLNVKWDDTTVGITDYKYKIKNGGLYIGLGLAAKFGGK